MKKICILFLLLPATQGIKAQTAIKAEMIYTVSGSPIRNGVVLVKNGKIENIGTNLSIPAGYTIYETKVLTPGFVDARSLVGISGALNIPTDQDQLEKSGPIQPDLRAIDAYNPEETLVKVIRDYGVTTIHTGHGVGALVSGQTMIAKTKAGTVETVTIKPLSMLAMTIGPSVSGNFTSPGTKAKQIAMIRTELLKAQAYLKKQSDKDSSKRPAADLKLDALVKLLNGEIKALITANSSVDIMSAIRLAKEFKLKLVLNGAAEAYRLIPEIKNANAEIILHATMARNGGDMVNMNMESASLLTKAGITVSIETGYEGYVPKTRILLFEAAQAMVFGLGFDDALKAITLNPARLLGIADKVGSIEKGKDADLVLFNGDPFEYLSKVCGVMIDGVMVKEDCR
ncbi:MAG TPA: amidohydrolase family protein [Ferruginibacter sp.]|mgnify:CR=1 FL=1|nr:amidohydrolase family protein [Chitinophagaceae bacterium]HQW92495.1 amidohydrolase family protein [Ferruginibacter sp.]